MDTIKFNEYLKKMNSLKGRELNALTHKHHIIPKCMGGKDSYDNIVKLTIQEHIDAHIQLSECFEYGTNERNSNLSAANVLHVWIGKESGIDLNGSNNPMWGKTHSLETKVKIGKKSKQKKYSDEYKKKLSIAFMGNRNHRYGVIVSDETKRKISEAQLGEKHHLWGKVRSNDTKEKISESQPNKVSVTKCDLNFNKIKTYPSISEAAKDNNITAGNLSHYFTKSKVTKYGSYRMLGGFIWIKEIWMLGGGSNQLKWQESAERSIKMFEEAGVGVFYYTKSLDN